MTYDSLERELREMEFHLDALSVSGDEAHIVAATTPAGKALEGVLQHLLDQELRAGGPERRQAMVARSSAVRDLDKAAAGTLLSLLAETPRFAGDPGLYSRCRDSIALRNRNSHAKTTRLSVAEARECADVAWDLAVAAGMVQGGRRAELRKQLRARRARGSRDPTELDRVEQKREIEAVVAARPHVAALLIAGGEGQGHSVLTDYAIKYLRENGDWEKPAPMGWPPGDLREDDRFEWLKEGLAKLLNTSAATPSDVRGRAARKGLVIRHVLADVSDGDDALIARWMQELWRPVADLGGDVRILLTFELALPPQRGWWWWWSPAARADARARATAAGAVRSACALAALPQLHVASLPELGPLTMADIIRALPEQTSTELEARARAIFENSQGGRFESVARRLNLWE